MNYKSPLFNYLANMIDNHIVFADIIDRCRHPPLEEFADMFSDDCVVMLQDLLKEDVDQ